MTGGLDGSWTTLSSTVFVYANGTVETGPQLPEARSGHCMVTLHDGKVLILGANPNSPSLYKNVIIFDPAQNTFTTGPSLSYNRDNAACTLFNSNLHDNRPVVLAAGGWGQATAEVYDYTNDNAWQTSIHFIISRFQSELTSALPVSHLLDREHSTTLNFFLFPTPIQNSNLKYLFQNNSQKLSPQHCFTNKPTKVTHFLSTTSTWTTSILSRL